MAPGFEPSPSESQGSQHSAGTQGFQGLVYNTFVGYPGGKVFCGFRADVDVTRGLCPPSMSARN